MKIATEILEMLRDDMVSHGLLVQQSSAFDDPDPDTRLRRLLAELLSPGQIEIGEAKKTAADHVEFIAWCGSVEARINRALDKVASARSIDKEFAYWLCLRENVDRFSESLPEDSEHLSVIRNAS